MNDHTSRIQRSKFFIGCLLALIFPMISVIVSVAEESKTQPKGSAGSRAGKVAQAREPGSGSQWTKSAKKKWAAAPVSARPSVIRQVVMQDEPTDGKSAENPPSTPSVPEGAAPVIPPVPDLPSEEQPRPSKVSDSGAAPSLPSIREQLKNAILNAAPKTEPPPATLPDPLLSIGDQSASSQASPGVVSPDPSHRVPLQTDQPGVQPDSSAGPSEWLDQELSSDDPIRRQRAAEFQKVRRQLEILFEQKRRKPAVTVPTPEVQVPENKPELHPEVGTTPEPQNPETPSDSATGHQETKAPEAAGNTQPGTEDPHPSGHVPEHAEVAPDRPSESDETQTITGDPGVPPAVTHTSEPFGGSASMVIEGTIDHTGLADNLFALGQFDMALNVYSQTDVSTLSPHEQFWVEYQLATCHRRLGRVAEASNRYRRLADKSEAGTLSEMSRWWVTTLEKKRGLQKALTDHPISNSHNDSQGGTEDHHGGTNH